MIKGFVSWRKVCRRLLKIFELQFVVGVSVCVCIRCSGPMEYPHLHISNVIEFVKRKILAVAYSKIALFNWLVTLVVTHVNVTNTIRLSLWFLFLLITSSHYRIQAKWKINYCRYILQNITCASFVSCVMTMCSYIRRLLLKQFHSKHILLICILHNWFFVFIKWMFIWFIL